MSELGDQKSEWHGGDKLQQRFDEIFHDIREAKNSLNLDDWFAYLQQLHDELRDDMKKDERDECLRLETEAQNTMKKYPPRFDPVKEILYIHPSIAPALRGFEWSLRLVHNRKGYKTPKSDSGANAMWE